MSAIDEVLTKVYPKDLKLAERGNDDLNRIRAELAALRATVAEQAQALEQAREVISATLADSLKPQHLQQCDVIIPAMRVWLKAHQAPVNNSAKSSSAQ